MLSGSDVSLLLEAVLLLEAEEDEEFLLSEHEVKAEVIIMQPMSAAVNLFILFSLKFFTPIIKRVIDRLLD